MVLRFEWRGAFANDEINELHAAAFTTRVYSADEWNWVELTASTAWAGSSRGTANGSWVS